MLFTSYRSVGRKPYAPLPAFICLAALFCLCSSARADEIAVWNFNDSNLIVDHGSGSLTTTVLAANFNFSSAGTSINARLGDPAGQGLTVQGGTGNVNNGGSMTLNVSTAGHGNIVVSVAIQRSSTGFNSNQFQYSLDGATFVNFGSPFTPATSFALVTFDLSGVAGLNNNPLAAFRIIFNGDRVDRHQPPRQPRGRRGARADRRPRAGGAGAPLRGALRLSPRRTPQARQVSRAPDRRAALAPSPT
jgi:hypothetical protein